MYKWQAEILKDNIEKYNNYESMIKWATDDNLILANTIPEYLVKNGDYLDIEYGTDYDEEQDCYDDVYQYYIISWQAAERLGIYTNELVYYSESLDLYLLGVKHWGTGWSCVEPNWKDLEEIFIEE